MFWYNIICNIIPLLILYIYIYIYLSTLFLSLIFPSFSLCCSLCLISLYPILNHYIILPPISPLSFYFSYNVYTPNPLLFYPIPYSLTQLPYSLTQSPYSLTQSLIPYPLSLNPLSLIPLSPYPLPLIPYPLTPYPLILSQILLLFLSYNQIFECKIIFKLFFIKLSSLDSGSNYNYVSFLNTSSLNFDLVFLKL